MYRRVTPPKGVTSPTWGPPPPCKQALRQLIHLVLMNLKMYHADGNSDGTESPSKSFALLQ